MKKHDEGVSFKEIANTILPKLWLILLVAVIAAAGTFVYCKYVKEDTYTSSFDIYIYKGDSNTSPSVSDIQTAENMIETYEYILKTSKFLQAVIFEMPAEYTGITPEALRAIMNISPVGNTGAIRISLTSTDAEFVLGFTKSFAPLIPSQIKKTIPNALKVEISEYPPQLGPIAPNSKNPVRNAIVAFVAAAVVVITAIWIHAAFDTVIRDKKKIEDNFDIPVLGVIPRQEVGKTEKEAEKDAV